MKTNVRVMIVLTVMSALVLGIPLAAQGAAGDANPVPCVTHFDSAYCQELNGFYVAVQQAKNAANDDERNKLSREALRNKTTLANPATRADLFVAGFAPTLQDAVNNLEHNAASEMAKTAQNWDQRRLDRVGTSSNAFSGATDLVARAGVTEFVSAALGMAGFSNSVAGNTGTMHINAGGLKSFLESGGKNVLKPANLTGDPEPEGMRFDLRNLDVSVMFDVNGQGTQTVPTTGTGSPGTPSIESVVLPAGANRWSGVTARYAVKAPYDPNSKEFRSAWLKQFNKQKAAIQDAAQKMQAAMESVNSEVTSDAMRKLINDSAAKYQADADNADPTALAGDFEASCAALQVLMQKEHGDFAHTMDTARLALSAYQAINDQTITDASAAAAKSLPLLLEYDYNRPLSQPATHAFKFVLAKQRSAAQYTINVAGTFYDGTIPPGAAYHRFRDIQASAEVDAGIGDNHQMIVTGAFYYQYQKDPSVLNITAGNLVPGTSITLPGDAQVLLGTSGSTVMGQVKGTVNLVNGLKIPFGVKFANRTNLLDSQETIGQVGITYDFSSFAAFLKKPSN
jgi:hypothetical protein